MKYQAIAIGQPFIWLCFRTYVQHWKTNCLECHFYQLILSEMTKQLLKKLKQKDGKLAVKNEQVFTPYFINKTLESGIKVGIMGITTPDTQWTS